MRLFSILYSTCLVLGSVLTAVAQTGETSDLDKLLADDNPKKKEYAMNAFKSSRVVMGQSMEMLGKGVLDFRILHRFGTVESGWRELFGLDAASMRMGFDYGVNKNFTIGIGRSTFNKELDGFVKYRILHQHTGEKAIPFSLLWVSGFTLNGTKISDAKLNTMENRLAYFHQAIIGRKFSDKFTLQLSPTFLHRNLVDLKSDKNDMIAVGIGTRYRFSKRSALVIDAYPTLTGARSNYNRMPLSIGLDIETGGHVFQLHVSNSRRMNEKAFLSETTQQWDKGQFHFGFNLSRVFTVVANSAGSW
jgi:hypothetical protein